MKLPKECPRCGCPFWEKNASGSGDRKSFKDRTRTWHVGPTSETVIIQCVHCHWSFSLKKESGKVVETDYFTKLHAILAGWANAEVLSDLFNWDEDVEIVEAEVDRMKGVLEVKLRVTLEQPEVVAEEPAV